MNRNPKSYQLLAVGSCPKEIKTKLCINEPLMKNDYLTFQVREISMGLHPSHQITSILWETKSFRHSSSEEKPSEAVWLLRKQKWGRTGEERKTEQGSVQSIYSNIYILIDILYNGCKGIYIEKFFQPSQLRNLMVGGLQGEEWKFIQKYLKESVHKYPSFARCMVTCENFAS